MTYSKLAWRTPKNKVCGVGRGFAALRDFAVRAFTAKAQRVAKDAKKSRGFLDEAAWLRRVESESLPDPVYG